MRRLIGSVVAFALVLAACADPSPPEPEPFTPTTLAPTTTLAPDPGPEPVEAPDDAGAGTEAGLSTEALQAILAHVAPDLDLEAAKEHLYVHLVTGELHYFPPVVLAGGVNLVTEEELLLHVAERAAEDIAYVIAGLYTSEPKHTNPDTGGDDYWGFGICDRPLADKSFADDRTISLQVLVNAEASGKCDPIGQDVDHGGDADLKRTLWVHVTFGKSVYVDGTVTESNCRKLPSAGTETTGEYQELTNDTDNPVDREISHTVEESSSSETSLSETVDLTSGTSVEAGASFPGGEAKATQSFEAHLGIEHGSVAGHESSHGEEIKETQTVNPGQIIGVTYTLDDSARECDINIDSVVDYTGIKVRLWRDHCGARCDSWGQDQLYHHGVYHASGPNAYFEFDSIDDIVRLAKGTNPHCDGCRFKIEDQEPDDSLGHLDDAKAHRTINIDGTRRYVSKDSASVVFKDITGLDTDCAHDVLSAEGTAVSDLDDKLEDCRS